MYLLTNPNIITRIL